MFRNGESYKGYLLNNQFHGKGKYEFGETDPEGRKQYLGEFEYGKFQGNGIMTYRNGDKI